MTPYNMLRRTKSSSLLPIVRLTNYFYPENTEVKELELTAGVEVYSSTARRVGGGGSTPDCEQLYRAMRLESFERIEEERVRKKYACQGLKLIASALAEDLSALSSKEVGFSRDLYVNGVEYILRGLPRSSALDIELITANLSPSEKQRIHILLRNLQPIPQDGNCYDEPYPFVIFLFRQLGLLLKHISPHVQSFAVRLFEFERRYDVARGVLEMGMGMAERGVDIAIKLGVNDALVNFGTALGRGMGESYRVYKET